MKQLLLALLLLAQQPTPILDALLKEIESLKLPLPPVLSLTVPVPAGANLQTVVDAALPGSTLLLEQGATFPVNLRLRTKVGTAPITIRTAGLDDTVLKPGVRVTPADAGPMAKLTCLDCLLPIVWAEAGAHDYALIGLEVVGSAARTDRTLVFFGYNPLTDKWATSYAEQPSNIVLDRVYVHAPIETGGHQGVMLDGTNLSVVNSTVSGFWEVGRDASAVGCIQAKGPLRIENNYLEASGENLMCGGSDPVIPGAIPADILVTRNHLAKPLLWKDPVWKAAHRGGGDIKNLIEFKNATRVTVTRNRFENIWVSGQTGHAVQLTPRNQGGLCPWCTVTHVVFGCNEIVNAEGYAFNLLATDNVRPSGTMADITLRDNLVRGAAGGVALSGNVQGLTVTRNVFLGISNSFLALFGAPQTALTFTGNFASSSEYGLRGDGTGQGVAALAVYAPTAVVTGNTIETTPARTITYPPGNTTVAPGTVTAASWACP